MVQKISKRDLAKNIIAKDVSSHFRGAAGKIVNRELRRVRGGMGIKRYQMPGATKQVLEALDNKGVRLSRRGKFVKYKLEKSEKSGRIYTDQTFKQIEKEEFERDNQGATESPEEIAKDKKREEARTRLHQQDAAEEQAKAAAAEASVGRHSQSDTGFSHDTGLSGESHSMGSSSSFSSGNTGGGMDSTPTDLPI